MPDWELALRLLIAAGLGSLIGAERERLVWAAGLRTHMLVSVGACLFMIVSQFGFADIVNAPHVILDPSRVAAQVVSGIGFLGAGSILLRGDVVRGLTTAASLWTVAAVGLAVGGGLYYGALAATGIILVILAGIKPIEEWYQSRANTHEVRVRADRGKFSIDVVNQALGYRSRRLTQFVCSHGENASDEIKLTFSRLSVADVTDIVRRLRDAPGVREVDSQS